jgi:hypothetical protein
MTRHIEIRLEKRGVKCIAELHDDLAPKTCQAVWDCLPQGENCFTAKWARNSLYNLCPVIPGGYPGLENASIVPIPGDLMLFRFNENDLHGGGYGWAEHDVATKGDITELSVHYGRNNLLLTPDAGFHACTVFGTVVKGLAELRAAGVDCWLGGTRGEVLSFHRA